MKKIGSKIYLFLCFLFLYAPILVLIIFSFNQSKSEHPYIDHCQDQNNSHIWYQYCPTEEKVFHYCVTAKLKRIKQFYLAVRAGQPCQDCNWQHRSCGSYFQVSGDICSKRLVNSLIFR